jgi:hypothetical protein
MWWYSSCIVAVMMRLPPAEPVAMVTSPVSRSSAMLLEMDDCGRLPGRIKLAGDAAKPNALT